MKKTFALVPLTLLAAILRLHAATVTLAWDPSTDPAVNGYKLYDGVATRAYTNTTPVSGRSTTNVTIAGLVFGTTYFFAITAVTTNGLQSNYSTEISYLVPNTPPVIVTQPTSVTNNVGATQTFTVVATGGNLTYQWLKNGVALVNGGNISGTTTATLTVSSLTGLDNGGYSVKVTGSGGTTTSSTAVLSIIPAAPTSLRVTGSGP